MLRIAAGIIPISMGLLLIAVAAGLVAVVLGIGLSYSLIHPLQNLTDRISRWRLRAESEPQMVEGTDEIRRLSAAFTDLLARLAEGEAQRQRMSADVACELRTPVTVMRSHPEAMSHEKSESQEVQALDPSRASVHSRAPDGASH